MIPELAAALLMYAVLPMWIAAGFADWACHRRTRIEATSGLKENLLHWLLFAEIGVAMLAVVLFEIGPGVLLVVLAAFLVHELTVYAELRYAVARREVRPVEQMVHSFMEILPLASLLLLAVHWDRVAGPDGFGFEWKRTPMSMKYLAGAAAGVFVFNVLPLAEETRRCWGSLRSPPAYESPRAAP